MNIAVVGGGPAGLYFALQAAGTNRVDLWERNPADATYGWGVVFSEETIDELRQVDYPSFAALSRHLLRWSNIEIRRGDERIVSTGHGFTAIARKALLEVLQERCRAVGVNLRFQEQAPTDLIDNYDLVVAADGVNSVWREERLAVWRTRRVIHPTKYIWFGTDFAFDGFTFIFEDTQHGLFQVHGYPYQANASTFIVECREEAWIAAGLDHASEDDSIIFCEKVFADHLGGHHLFSNHSTWLSFVTMHNRIWRQHRLVLLGDAAHTAHFSIGSGTKLAMEDAIALNQALADFEHLDQALASYQVTRQPPVSRFQEAAMDSSRYFSSVQRYWRFPVEQFAFNLLTRSGRVSHLDMEKRDPVLTAAVDSRLAGTTLLRPPRPASTPLDVGGLRLPNRIAVTAPDLNTTVSPGAGLVVLDELAVSAEGRVTLDSPEISQDSEKIQNWIAAVKSTGAVAAASIAHGGRRAGCLPRRFGADRPVRPLRPLLAAAAIPYTSRHATPRVLGNSDRDRVTTDFVNAATLAFQSGFEILIIDCAKGYLLGGFLSPLSNPDRDQVTFPLQLVTAVRDVWTGPLAVRLSMSDWAAGGVSEAVGLEQAKEFASVGLDFIWVTAGGTVANEKPPYRRRYVAPLADTVRNEIPIPVMVGGAITTMDEVDTLLAAGKADICLLDPYLYRAI